MASHKQTHSVTWPVTSRPIPVHTEEKFKDTHLGTLEPLSELSGLPLLLQVSAPQSSSEATALACSETFCLGQKPFGDRGLYTALSLANRGPLISFLYEF